MDISPIFRCAVGIDVHPALICVCVIVAGPGPSLKSTAATSAASSATGAPWPNGWPASSPTPWSWKAPASTGKALTPPWSRPAWLLAFGIDPAHFHDARQATAFAGLNPRLHESGTLKGRPRLSKVGHAFLRNAPCMPAMAAMAALYKTAWAGASASASPPPASPPSRSSGP